VQTRQLGDFTMTADAVLPHRLGWRWGPISGDSVDKRAAMARLSALLYISGGGLGLLSLLLPGDPGRDAAAILDISVAALLTAVVPLVGFTRLPMPAFHLLTVVGSFLITFGLLFGGTNAYVYGLIYFWIVIYASYFFSTPATMLYLALVGTEYAVVLLGRTTPGLSSVTWLITIGTLAVAVALIRLLTSRLAAVIHDLSASEAAAHASGDRLRALIDAAPTAIVELDSAGRVLIWNSAAERIFGWGAADVLGRACPISWMSQAPTAQQAEDVQVETAVSRADGEEVLVNLSTAAVTGASGQATGIMMIATDMTEHRQLEQQLHRAQKMEAVGRLAGGIAHDFNNILLAVRSHAWLLANAVEFEEAPRGSVDEIERAVDRASNLTRQLLTFSQRELGSMDAVDVCALITSMQGMLCPLIGEDIALIVDPDSGGATVLADEVKLEQVLVNLAINARDAMPDGGRLTISARTRRDPREVEITVADTGVGIPPDQQQLIFEPFFTTKRESGGTGLGLATVYGVIDALGGQIDVASWPNRGTRFTIRLPAAELHHTVEQDRSFADGPRRGTETLLLVEDETGVREPLHRALQSYGYTVLVAADGEQALHRMATHDSGIDLLITDVVMPRLNGPDLVQRVRQVHPDMRVLYVSGYVERSLSLLGEESGGDTDGAGASKRSLFLQKPFSPDDLAMAVRALLDASGTASPAARRRSPPRGTASAEMTFIASPNRGS
jgi:two-component system cell cycle sensor histidine kinase/response regulator CckA